ncbi:FAD-binding oxidoreductase [Pseudoteredinibacter isoporae]|uniref:FAD-binding oxidoreductase n=1 Tax=Pseudoteredinibacter isoporae TaxID=570281 RepID=UPI00310BB79C
MGIIERLQQCLDSQSLIVGEALRAHPACIYLIPKAIIRPGSTEELAAAMTVCHELGQTVVTRGGGSGLVGGTVCEGEDILLSLERMNRIESIDVLGRTATVQAGVPLQALQDAAAAKALFFPLDLGARGSATLGGNLATNAGGNRVIRYGMTRDMVLGLEVVLSDGRIISAMNSVIKNNSGYDLKHLFVGSEGTLGIITRAVMRLQPAPLSENTALVAVSSFDRLVRLLGQADQHLGGAMSAFEVMWQSYYEAICQGGKRHRYPIRDSYPFYVLIESLGANQEADNQRFAAALEALFEQGLIEDAVLTKSRREAEALWAIRDDVEALMSLFPYFVFDVSVPLAEMESYVAEVEAGVKAAWPEDQCCIVFGHLGDGNLHFVIRAAGEFEQVREQVNEIVYEPLRSRKGVISAEHGIGLEKRPYLNISRSQDEIELMKLIKRSFDPKGILNPGKIFEA